MFWRDWISKWCQEGPFRTTSLICNLRECKESQNTIQWGAYHINKTCSAAVQDVKMVCPENNKRQTSPSLVPTYRTGATQVLHTFKSLLHSTHWKLLFGVHSKQNALWSPFLLRELCTCCMPYSNAPELLEYVHKALWKSLFFFRQCFEMRLLLWTWCGMPLPLIVPIGLPEGQTTAEAEG